MKYEVALVCKVNDGDVIIARTHDDAVIKSVKYAILKEAADEASMWKDIDSGCYQLALADFQRLALLLKAEKADILN